MDEHEKFRGGEGRRRLRRDESHDLYRAGHDRRVDREGMGAKVRAMKKSEDSTSVAHY